MDDSVCDIVMPVMPFEKHIKLDPCLTPYTNAFLNGWKVSMLKIGFCLWPQKLKSTLNLCPYPLSTSAVTRTRQVI